MQTMMYTALRAVKKLYLGRKNTYTRALRAVKLYLERKKKYTRAQGRTKGGDPGGPDLPLPEISVLK